MTSIVRLSCIATVALVLGAAASLCARAQTESHPDAAHGDQMHGGTLYGQVLVEQLEYRWKDGHDVTAWDAQAWYGGDYEKLRLKTEGNLRSPQRVNDAEAQLLYSRLVGYYWDLQAGVRHDFRPKPSRSYAVIGLQGLAPGYFEVDASTFVSQDGDLSARLKADYDLLITQRLILQPKMEINVAARDVPELHTAAGLNDIELGLRLRYEFAREFAPYVGVNWKRNLGETAQLVRRSGDDPDEVAGLVGVRFWF
ncbi:MAG TPA: copper resistance protein B [Alphaproteobacteria bacterium]|jgi:copper resistance protein B|nr:copper resistance protein B [Alphaproteobacteria bacterium]